MPSGGGAIDICIAALPRCGGGIRDIAPEWTEGGGLLIVES